jgi:hypothetical protein
MLRRLVTSLLRASSLVAIGLVLLSIDATAARAMGIPALAPVILSAGWLAIAAAISHVARVILFPSLDLMAIGRRAVSEANVGAGLVFAGICLVLAALLMSQARAQTLMERARVHLPVLVAEQRTHWPDAPDPHTMAGQVEAESAWRATAELRTSREWGAGLAQLTRAFDANGAVRFDRLADARRLHPSLAGWTWDERFDVARQFRSLVLMNQVEWQAIVGTATVDDRWSMTLSAYNGGRSGLMRDRALCAGVPGCDPSRWFGHVERHSWRAKTVVHGYGRSFIAINRDYVRSTMHERRHRYAAAWGDGDLPG